MKIYVPFKLDDKTKTDEEETEGTEMIGNDVMMPVRTLGAGWTFGELGLLTQPFRTATIVCTANSKLGSLDRNTYRSILGQ